MNLRCPNCGSMITYLTDNVTDPLNPTYICADCNYLFTEKESVIGKPDQNAKADQGKEQLTLVPTKIIHDICKIRMYGNDKYGDPENWRTVEIERYRDACYRHWLSYIEDPHGVDDESGMPHLWHVACNIAFLCEMETYDK